MAISPQRWSSDVVLIRYLANVTETAQLAKQLAKIVAEDDLVLLVGGIGSGKTTLVKALARDLGVTEGVTSPSFVIHAVYESGRVPLNHVDLYRLDDTAEIRRLGLEDVMDGALTVVEWADRFGEFAEPYLRITLNLGVREDERIASIEGVGGTWPQRVVALDGD